MDYQTLTLELQRRLSDLAQIKHPLARYQSALAQAILQYPSPLWPLEIDGATLDTVDGQYEYDLSAVTGLDKPQQLLRVWVDDTDGVKRETGRWHVLDDAGTLTLVLDEDPGGAYDITLEYRKAPAALTNPTDVTDVDDEWLLSKALALLLAEADWDAENPQQVATLLELHRSRVLERQAELFRQGRRPSRRARTTAWRQYVS